MSEEPDPMSPAQRQAVQKAWDILSEHFDHLLLVADWEVELESGKREDAHEVWWHGGSLCAVGLADFAHDRLLSSGKRYNEPGENAS